VLQVEWSDVDEWPMYAARVDHPNPDVWYPEQGQSATAARAVCTAAMSPSAKGDQTRGA
jgi:hypothetical protein